MFLASSVLDITPAMPTFLGAAPRLDIPSESVREPIEAVLLLLRTDPESMPVLMVGVDLLYPGPDLRRRLEESMSAWLPPSQIWLSATHTHRAPLTDQHKPGLGTVNKDYLEGTIAKITQAATALVLGDGGTPCRLRVRQDSTPHGVNRRRLTRWLDRELTLRKRIRLAPNPDGPTDDSVLLATFEDRNGRPLAAIWNYACHPVADFEQLSVAAHFPGVAREALRRHLGAPSLPVLYLQGFSGNIRPSSTTTAHTLRQKLDRALRGPRFFDMTASSYASWTGSLGQALVRMSATPGVVSPGDQIVSARRVAPASEFVDGARPEAAASFHAIRIDDALSIVGASAEVVCEYAPFVRGRSSTPYTMCVGCLDDTFGYAPTESMLSEGGYEAGGYCADFGVSTVRPEIASAMHESFDHVLSAVADH